MQIEDETLQPSKVVCIGRNYVAHIEELNNAIPDQPVIFIKPNSAISDNINLNGEDEIHYEGEISFVIKNNQISAVGFGLDLTKRTVQSKLKAKGLPWERAKAFDGSALFSEFKTLNGSIETLRLELHINGELIQQGGCDLMLFKPDAILKDVSSFLTLEDGDVIMTGTPAGVGQIKSGDEFVGKIFSADQLLVDRTWLVNK
ncbi:MAG: fumarylacetoacetate hydrolase family protein [Cocleimonas sp.]